MGSVWLSLMYSPGALLERFRSSSDVLKIPYPGTVGESIGDSSTTDIELINPDCSLGPRFTGADLFVALCLATAPLALPSKDMDRFFWKSGATCNLCFGND